MTGADIFWMTKKYSNSARNSAVSFSLVQDQGLGEGTNLNALMMFHVGVTPTVSLVTMGF